MRLLERWGEEGEYYIEKEREEREKRRKNMKAGVRRWGKGREWVFVDRWVFCEVIK